MEINYLDHIGIAVKSIEDSIPVYEKLLGIKCYSIEYVADQFVKTAFFQVGQTKIELLESMDTEGPIGSFINKKGEGIHHIAFAVENTNEALANAKENGFRLIDTKSRKGAEGMDIGFLNPKKTNGVLVEFCSK
ncbi:methylmalonyl-CoA epimerase [Bacteroidota bacterium]